MDSPVILNGENGFGASLSVTPPLNETWGPFGDPKGLLRGFPNMDLLGIAAEVNEEERLGLVEVRVPKTLVGGDDPGPLALLKI